MKYKVLIIGSGNRVQNTIIPALVCLQNKFEIIGVISKTIKTIRIDKYGTNIVTKTNFDHFDFSKIDYVFVAVTLSQTLNVVIKLLKYRKHKFVLFLDTPVFSYLHVFGFILLKYFYKVYVTEEFPYIKPIHQAKILINRSVIGAVKQVNFYNFGYKYHALAAIKYIFDDFSIKSVKNIRGVFDNNCKVIRFNDLKKGFIFEPQFYEGGRFLIIGENGTISNFSTGEKNNIFINLKSKNGRFESTQVNGELVPDDNLDICYKKYIDSCIYNKSLMKSLKIRALMELLMINDTQINYNCSECFLDYLKLGTIDVLKV